MPLPYDLGEMKSETGEVLRYEVERLTFDLMLKLFQVIQNYSAYQRITERLQSPMTSLYFKKIIKSEIYPIVLNLCIIRWYKRNKIKIKKEEGAVFVPSSGIYPLLERVWSDKEIPIRVAQGNFNIRSLKLPLHAYRNSGLGIFAKKILGVYHRWKYAGDFSELLNGKSNVAVEYGEGLSLNANRRSDIIWFPKSRIDPQRILIYFNGPDSATDKPVTEEVLRQIEELGMKWVCLRPGFVARKNISVWYPSFSKDETNNPFNMDSKDSVEKWIYVNSTKLLKKIRYWKAFHREFDIKIHFVIGENSTKYIAQSISFDIEGQNSGFLLGKQRSEYFWPPQVLVAYHPKDIFFIWSSRTKEYVTSDYNNIRVNVVVGYPNGLSFNDAFRNADELRNRFLSKGVRFIVALFDNVYGPRVHFSSKMMETFYLNYLNWLFEDNTVGIIVKSKKPVIFKNLKRLIPLLSKAKSTGRWINLPNEFGRLPIDAAAASDMAVGIGISSAVIESVIAGCRGLHCDLTGLRSHEFYQWGYEHIIFDDIGRMMNVLKQYKADRNSYPNLGDWTPFLDRLDPFRDEQGGERMGSYMRWLLEGLDKGKNRDEAIQCANKLYAAQWGKDKIIDRIQENAVA